MSKNDSASYWYGFNCIKGLLILFVFMGHVIPGVLRETFPRYAIYSFHMPLFIGISGFLLNIEKFDATTPRQLIVKYWKRMILPWGIAVVCYFVVNNVMAGSIASVTLRDVLHSFLRPYYHLWYILGFVSYLLITFFLWKIFKRSKHKWIWMFLIASIISFISKWDLLAHDKMNNTFLNTLYEYIQYDFRLYNLVFFILGIYCRDKYEKKKRILSDKMVEVARTSMIVSAMVVAVLFFFQYPNVERMMFYVMNFCILPVVFYDCVNSSLPRSFVLEFIGENSLPIYLYHVFCIVCSKLIFSIGSEGYYIICVSTFIIVCALVYCLRNIPFINKTVFGSTNSRIQ